ncbi:hypothetical protein BV20DRAFT_960232, partial [Pilatotrama ljubarskyi]
MRSRKKPSAFACRRTAKAPQRARGGDTGFWRAVEAKLDEQYKLAQGKDRENDAAWIEWAKAQVTKDHALFSARRTGRRSRHSNATIADEDVSVVLGTDAGNENVDSGLMSPGTPSYVDPQLPEDAMDDDNQEDSHADPPDLNTMGDIASTIPI